MTKTTKEYVKSSIITFVAAFLMAVLPFLGDAQWTRAAAVAVAVAAARAGVKAVVEMFIGLMNKMKLDMADIDDEM